MEPMRQFFFFSWGVLVVSPFTTALAVAFGGSPWASIAIGMVGAILSVFAAWRWGFHS